VQGIKKQNLNKMALTNQSQIGNKKLYQLFMNNLIDLGPMTFSSTSLGSAPFYEMT
jgi:hypothetical protein